MLKVENGDKIRQVFPDNMFVDYECYEADIEKRTYKVFMFEGEVLLSYCKSSLCLSGLGTGNWELIKKSDRSTPIGKVSPNIVYLFRAMEEKQRKKPLFAKLIKLYVGERCQDNDGDDS